MSTISNLYLKIWDLLSQGRLDAAEKILNGFLPKFQIKLINLGGTKNIGAGIIKDEYCITENISGYEVLVPCRSKQPRTHLFIKAGIDPEEALRGMVLYRLYRFCPNFVPVFAAGYYRGTISDRNGTPHTNPYMIVMKSCTSDLEGFIKSEITRIISQSSPNIFAAIHYYQHKEALDLIELQRTLAYLEYTFDSYDAEVQQLTLDIDNMLSQIRQIMDEAAATRIDGLEPLARMLEREAESIAENVEMKKERLKQIPSEREKTAIALEDARAQYIELHAKCLREYGPPPDMEAVQSEIPLIDEQILPLLANLRIQQALIDYAMIRYMDAEQSDYQAGNFLVDVVKVVDGIPQGSLPYHGIDLVQKSHMTIHVDGRTISIPLRYEADQHLTYVYVVKNGDPGQMLHGEFSFNPTLENLIDFGEKTVKTSSIRQYKVSPIDYNYVYRFFNDEPFKVDFNIIPTVLRYKLPNVMDYLWKPNEYTSKFLLDFLYENCKDQQFPDWATFHMDWNKLENWSTSLQRIEYG